MSERFTIDRLGARGDGIAETGAGPLYVPFTLPGEAVEAERSGARGRLTAVTAPSPERVPPPCPHFGVCGGCDLQHAGTELYQAFKRDRVVDALAREGVETMVGALVPCPPASRRRVVFSAVSANGRVLFGYNEALTNRIVDIVTCPIAVPEIVTRLADLRALARLAVDRKAPLRMTVAATASGLDIFLEGHAKLTEAMRRKIIAFALDKEFARVSVPGETLIESRAPTIDLDGIAVAIPAGAFLQAVASAERAMAALVTEHLAGARRIADLFAGIGTFGLRLARSSAVHGLEADGAAVQAMLQATRAVPGLKPVTVEKRDLFRRPLNAKDLKVFDGAVFDPPRAGAEAQSRELAASGVSRIAAVSCNPVTLARDLRILLDGGYRLLSVTPIDQFLWSYHVEAVALLER